MDIKVLIGIIIVLLIILLLLLFLVVLPARRKKKAQEEAARKKAQAAKKQKKELTIYDVEDFDTLRAKVRRTSLSKEELEETIDLIIKYYSKIPPKLGIRTHPEYDKYLDLMIALARHPQTDKTLILRLDRALHKANPQYKLELNEALRRALNARTPPPIRKKAQTV